jgi:hypothetical protein
MGGSVRDADPEREPAAGDFVDIGARVGEILGDAAIDRRDRRGELDALRPHRQRDALRHVAEDARHVDTRKPAPLHLERQIERLLPPAGHRDEGDGWEGFGHIDRSKKENAFSRRRKEDAEGLKKRDAVVIPPKRRSIRFLALCAEFRPLRVLCVTSAPFASRCFF